MIERIITENLPPLLSLFYFIMLFSSISDRLLLAGYNKFHVPLFHISNPEEMTTGCSLETPLRLKLLYILLPNRLHQMEKEKKCI